MIEEIDNLDRVERKLEKMAEGKEFRKPIMKFNPGIQGYEVDVDDVKEEKREEDEDKTE